MMWGRALLGPALVTASVVSARDVAAEPDSGVRLVYADQSTANCPSEASLRAAAVSRLGYDPFSASGQTTVRVTITRAARGLRGEIRVDDPSREGAASRAIESTSGDCVELGKAMALAISIAVDTIRIRSSTASDVPSRPPARERTNEPGDRPPRVASADADDEHLVPPASEPELLGDGSIASDVSGTPNRSAPLSPEILPWQVSLHGLTSVGFTPGVTVGGALGAGWIGHNQSLEIEGRADLPQVTNHANGSISVWPLLFTIAPCVNVRGWAFCGLGRVGALHGSGRGFGQNLSGSSLLATVGFRLANEAILTERLGFRVFFDLDWLATSNSFDVDGRSAWAVSTWAVSLGLGMTTRFP